MAHAQSPLQLPIEVWERIIDSLHVVGDNYDRDALRACCLTCRAWVSRSRFHLYLSVTLRSKEHLAHVVNAICTSPTLCDRVHRLTVVGDDNDVSWVSTVPLQLAPKLKFLQFICFRKVDFRKLNPRFQASFALFRSIFSVIFKDVQSSQLNQMTRLASAVRAALFSVESLTFDLGRPAILSSQRLTLRYPNLRFVFISLSPDMLSSISQSWSFPLASLSGVNVRTDWPTGSGNMSGWTTHLDTLQRIMNLFQQLYASNSDFVSCDITYRAPLGGLAPTRHLKCLLSLKRTLHNDHDSLQKDRLSLELTCHLDTTNHDDFISMGRFLSAAAHARPDIMELQFFDRETGTTHPDQIAWTPANDLEPMANLLARWKCIDDALSSDAFANVINVSVPVIPEYHLGDIHCVNPLVNQLLPCLTARGVISPCVHDNLCFYHEPNSERYDNFRYLTL